MSRRVVKSISMPEDELIFLEKAAERILRETDYPIVNQSMLFRMGVQALLKVSRDSLKDIVWSVPELKSGPRIEQD